MLDADIRCQGRRPMLPILSAHICCRSLLPMFAVDTLRPWSLALLAAHSLCPCSLPMTLTAATLRPRSVIRLAFHTVHCPPLINATTRCQCLRPILAVTARHPWLLPELAAYYACYYSLSMPILAATARCRCLTTRSPPLLAAHAKHKGPLTTLLAKQTNIAHVTNTHPAFPHTYNESYTSQSDHVHCTRNKHSPCFSTHT